MVKMGKDHCPNCNKLLDAATELSKEVKPNPGDISICIYCGTILVFAVDMALMVATMSDLEGLSIDALCKLSIAQMEIAKRKNYETTSY